MKNDKIETIGISTDNNVNGANTSEIVLFQPNNSVCLEVLVDNETVWLTQAQMVMLFDKNKRTISEHISNIFKEGELEKYSVVRNIRTTATDKKLYDTNYYSLDVIISVGYRVKSPSGTKFRIWANKVLKEYILKGYAINQRFERIEQHISQTDLIVAEHSKKINFFVRTALPALEGIFYGKRKDCFPIFRTVTRNIRLGIV